MNLSNLKSIYKSTVKLILGTLFCTLLLVSSCLPAAAATSSRPSEGAASLNEIQSKTDNVTKSNPRSMSEVQSTAKKGLNAVQGSADKGKMNTPENSQDATTVKEQVKDALSNITGN